MDKSLPQVLDDHRILHAWFNTIQSGRQIKAPNKLSQTWGVETEGDTLTIDECKEIHDKVVKWMVDNGAHHYSVGNIDIGWPPTSGDMNAMLATSEAEKIGGYAGIYLVEPHGEMIWQGIKKAIVKSRNFSGMVGKELLLVSGNKAYGTIILKPPMLINDQQFGALRGLHKITEEERLLWWPGHTKLYLYHFTIVQRLPIPKEIGVPQGVQTFIKDTGIEKLADSPLRSGIIDFERYDEIKGEKGMWEAAIHEHHAEKAGRHYDLRLSPPGSTIAYSWVLRKLPEPGEKVLAVEQPTHEASYMDFVGEIEKGYGKGKVYLPFRDTVEVLKVLPNRITFNVYEGRTTKRLTLIKMQDKQWLLYNITPTRESRKDIPTSKPDYKEIPYSEVDLHNSEQVLTPKYDGAHTVFILRPEKYVEAFSYRPVKTGYGLSDFTYKVDVHNVKVPKEIGNTIVRGELFGRKNGDVVPGRVTSGLLNSSVPRSRQMQKELGKLDQVIFDIVKFKGKNVEDENYATKIQYLQEVNKHIPELKLPPMAENDEDKKKLYEEVLGGTYPETYEGLVVWDRTKPQPIRAKVKKDYDVYIRGFTPSTSDRPEIGAIKYSYEPEGEIVGKVGTGFSSELRRYMYEHPDQFLGQVVKVESQEQLPSGALRMPVFKEVRYEKWPHKGEK